MINISNRIKQVMIICIDARMFNSSGIGVHIKNMIHGLIKSKNFKIILIGNEVILKKHFFYSDLIQVISCNSAIYSIKEQFILPFIIPKCDIFWSPHYNIPIFPLFQVRKRVVTIHDVFHLAYSKNLSLVQVVYAKLMMFLATIYSELVFTVSDFSKYEIVKYTKVSDRKVKVIYNGISTYFSPQKDLLKAKENYILYVGNIKPHKNLKNALLSFKEITSKYNDLKFYIVGNKEGFITEGYSEIKNIVDELEGKVFFLGWIDDSELRTYYTNAQLLLFPSYYEGFGLPPLEAMACCCPTAVANIASMPEICEDASIYFNPFDVNEITIAMDKILSSKDVQHYLKVKGMNHVEKFRWEKSVRLFEKYLSEIINL